MTSFDFERNVELALEQKKRKLFYVKSVMIVGME